MIPNYDQTIEKIYHPENFESVEDDEADEKEQNTEKNTELIKERITG